MAVSLKHAFQSAKADGADATLVQPSNWNAEHTLTQASGFLLGRTTAGAGATEEISVSAALTLTGGILSTAAHTGDVTSAAGSMALTVAKIQGVAVGGVTGTGNVVFSDAPTFTGTMTAATISASGTISDSKGNVRDIPAEAAAAGYTLVAADKGKVKNLAGGATVPSGVFAAGEAVSLFNNTAGNVTITQGAGVTMYLAGTATTGNRTLAQRGVVTVLCVAANTFVISGGGLS